MLLLPVHIQLSFRPRFVNVSSLIPMTGEVTDSLNKGSLLGGRTGDDSEDIKRSLR
jgi:hypothetical protein